MSRTHVPVLIVGSGLAGLTTAVMLAWRGVRPLLVERHEGTLMHPRARSVNFRSMELLRVAGLEPDLLAAGGDAMKDFSIIIAESVTGREIKTILPRGAWDTSALSPAKMSGAGQDRVEPVLRRHAEALGAELRYGTELISFTQDDQGITALLRDRKSGAQSEVRAEYLVAADGNRSSIRERLGIPVRGQGTISHNLSIVFEADLSAALRGRELALYYLQNPNFAGAFINTDEPNRALVSVEYDPNSQHPEDFDTQRCVDLVRAAVGLPDLQPRILEVLPWEMASRTAERYSAGRIFLAGDAAHTMPPTGGLGGQTAIQDGYDLAWKLAAVIHGHAGPELLATYEAERKPVGDLTVSLQTANYVSRMRPDRTDLSGEHREHEYFKVAFGYRYRSAAILQDTADDGERFDDPAQTGGQPGTRAPHLPFQHKGVRISSLDLIGRDFVLLVGPQGASWSRAAGALPYDCNVPLSTYRIGSELLDLDQLWTSRFGVTASGAVLLRPDGFIAWRSRTEVTSPRAVLLEVLARVLCRPVATLSGRASLPSGTLAAIS